MSIPLADVARQNAALADEILAEWKEILLRGAFVGGRWVDSFEKEWAAYCGAGDAVGVSSGTDALLLMLLAAGVRPGDEVVTVPFTFAATVEAIIQAGARPVLAEVDPATLTLDPRAFERAISPRTRAVIPVHLYGHPAAMEEIGRVAAARGIDVLEDAAQAQGAELGGRRAGGIGRAAAFSFYPSKNLGACGEAGAITTSDPELARRARMLRDHGQQLKNAHEFSGYNGRLDALQAAALRVKLRRLDAWNDGRRRLAEIYNRLLRGVPGLSLPVERPGARAVYHLYVVRTARRDELRDALAREGIATGLHYPHALHLQPAFSHLGYGEGSFPASEEAARTVLSLPLYPELEPRSVETVAGRIRAFFDASKAGR